MSDPSQTADKGGRYGEPSWYWGNEGICPQCGVEVGSEIEAIWHEASHNPS